MIIWDDGTGEFFGWFRMSMHRWIMGEHILESNPEPHAKTPVYALFITMCARQFFILPFHHSFQSPSACSLGRIAPSADDQGMLWSMETE